MKWELEALKILARNESVPWIALRDTISGIEDARIAALEYSAKWIENSLNGENDERVIEFGKNMAMSIRAAK